MFLGREGEAETYFFDTGVAQSPGMTFFCDQYFLTPHFANLYQRLGG